MTKEEEILTFIYANRRYFNFSKWEPSESPDIIVKEDNKTIGIEITELTNTLTPQGQEQVKLYSLENKIIKLAKKRFSEKHDIKLLINIKFKHPLKLDLNRRNKLIDEIVNSLEVKNHDPNKLSYNHEVTKDLPDEIDGIYFDIAPFLDESIWFTARTRWTEDLNQIIIENAIKKKEKLIKKYLSKCDTVYLLLIEGATDASCFDEIIKPIPEIKSQFEKIVLYRGMHNEIVEIKGN